MGCPDASLSILITDDKEIQQLNSEWLERDRPTDVIAWSQIEGQPFPTSFIGDVVISIETAKRQAEEYGVDLETELDRLLVHGVLHLLGHDHVHGGRQAAKMRSREDELTELLSKEESGS